MPRPKNTDERRQQIVQGLMKVMAKKGYDSASVGDIAKAARVTPGLVHYHFKDKNEVLVGLAQWMSADTLQSLDRHLDATESNPQASLEAVVDFFLGLGATSRPEILACWLVLSSEALRRKDIKQVVEKTLLALRERIQGLIVEGMRSGRFRSSIDACAAATGLVAAIQGYFVLAGSARSLIPKGSAAHTVKWMLRGLLGEPL